MAGGSVQRDIWSQRVLGGLFNVTPSFGVSRDVISSPLGMDTTSSCHSATMGLSA